MKRHLSHHLCLLAGHCLNIPQTVAARKRAVDLLLLGESWRVWYFEDLLGRLSELVDLQLHCPSLQCVTYVIEVHVALVGEWVEH